MATRTSARAQKDSSIFTSFLASAVLEWCLIIMLLLHALFSYLVTKFANVCGLQTPCLLCSRLDHILGSEKPGFFRDLICHAHKLEISKKSGGEMCEGCISSIITDKKSGGGAYNASMNKLEPYIEYCVDDGHNIHLKSPAIIDGDSVMVSLNQDDLLRDPLLKVPLLSSSSMGLSSCCNEPSSKTQRLLSTKSIGDGATELDGVRSSGMMEHGHLNHLDGLEMRREKLCESTLGSYLGNQGCDPLPYIACAELKITPDFESKVSISDDDDRSGLVHNTDNLLDESVAQCLQLDTGSINACILPKTMCSDLVLEKLIDQIHMAGHSLSVPPEKFHTSEPHDSTSLVSVAGIDNSLKEINCNQDETRDNLPAASKLVSFDEFSSSLNVKESLAEVNKEKYVIDIGDTVCIAHTENTEVLKQSKGSISANSSLQINHTVNNPGLFVPSYMDLNDGCKLAVGITGSLLSPTFAELHNGKDSTGIYDDLKLLLSQMAAVRGYEFSWGDVGPRVDGHGGDDSTLTGTSSVIGLQILTKKLLIERNESSLESFDGSLVSEIEGEIAVDRLKQQIELDRKSMNALYKELEEERSASAIAANEAMAMINQLQEERAALQMEAFQYQRMMEEQAEYDQEALQKANDLLNDREKEIQDLEEELETYRKWYPSVLKVEKVLKLENDSEGREMRAIFHENDTDYKANKIGTLKDTLLDFEGEKFYILKCLKKLENKLRSSNNGVHFNSSELCCNRGGFPDDKCKNMTLSMFGEEQDHPLFADNPAGNGGSLRTESHAGSDVEDVYSTASAENDVLAIWKQISHLNERLITIEEDRNFLEKTVNTLKKGNEGFCFVQEIASHLRELRRIGMGTREQAVA